MKRERRLFKIADNVLPDPRAPYVLIDCSSDEVIRLGDRVSVLADHAFDNLGADEVRHDEDLIRAADSRFRKV